MCILGPLIWDGRVPISILSFIPTPALAVFYLDDQMVILVTKGGNSFISIYNNGSINWMLGLPPGTFGPLMPEIEITVLIGVAEVNYEENIRL